jgi:hypothetical protein
MIAERRRQYCRPMRVGVERDHLQESGGGFGRLHRRAIAGIASVVVRIIRAEPLEAAMHPKILLGYAANMRFQ